MPVDQTLLLNRLIGGDPRAAEEVLALAPSSASASLLVAAALVSRDRSRLERAMPLATTVRERQDGLLRGGDLRAGRRGVRGEGGRRETDDEEECKGQWTGAAKGGSHAPTVAAAWRGRYGPLVPEVRGGWSWSGPHP